MMESNNMNISSSKNSKRSLFGIVLVLLLVSVIALSWGEIEVPIIDVGKILIYKVSRGQYFGDILRDNPIALDVVWHLRLPRIILAIFVGGGMALCGVVMQATVRNPLADPYLLGISSGGVLGATVAILFGSSIGSMFSNVTVTTGAFIGALLASATVLLLANVGNQTSSVKLVLLGTAINALCSALSNFIVYLGNNAEGIKSVSFWSMGSLATGDLNKIFVLGVLVLVASLYFVLQSNTLNVLLVGDESAIHLGVNVKKYRTRYTVICAIITGTIVATCGIIGFVGLIIPHITRSIVGSDHHDLLPFAVCLGSLFLVCADLISRILIPHDELPIGIVTSLIGTPIFIKILLKENKLFGGQ